MCPACRVGLPRFLVSSWRICSTAWATDWTRAGARAVPTGSRQAGRRFTRGDAIEAIDQLARRFLARLQREGFRRSGDRGERSPATFGAWPAHDGRLGRRAAYFVCRRAGAERWRYGTPDEIGNLLDALEGRYVPAGPSGAPTRRHGPRAADRAKFLRRRPACVASQPPGKSARSWHARSSSGTAAKPALPETVGISVWGTSAMRTHGDDVAEVFALLGVRPDLAARESPVLGDRGHPAGGTGPAAGRRRLSHQRLLPRRVSAPDRLLDDAVRRSPGSTSRPNRTSFASITWTIFAAGLDEGPTIARLEAERNAPVIACSAPSPAVMAPASCP